MPSFYKKKECWRVRREKECCWGKIDAGLNPGLFAHLPRSVRHELAVRSLRRLVCREGVSIGSWSFFVSFRFAGQGRTSEGNDASYRIERDDVRQVRYKYGAMSFPFLYLSPPLLSFYSCSLSCCVSSTLTGSFIAPHLSIYIFPFAYSRQRQRQRVPDPRRDLQVSPCKWWFCLPCLLR